MPSIAERLQPVARELFGAWSRLPPHDGVPRREDFDPMAVVHILPVVSLIERIGQVWRLRLVGTEIERRWGRNLTGIEYSEILSPAVAALTMREFATICDCPCGSWSLRHLESHGGRRLTVETLRLPLRAPDRRVALILSCSGELSGRVIRDADRSRAIVTLGSQCFLDIGAGAPAPLTADTPAVA